MRHREHRFRHQSHAFTSLLPLVSEGLTVTSRRNMLKAGLAGMAGLSAPALLQARETALEAGAPLSRKSVILLWMTGGPSHIDTWDPKPDRPYVNRGPFSPIATAVPGIEICEHLPKQAAMMDRFTIIRAVDARHSNHEPNTVFQTGNLEAAPRVNPLGRRWPAIGSIIGKYRGANAPGMPPYVAFIKNSSHLAFAGYLGREHDPFLGNSACSLPAYDLVGTPLGTVSGGEMFHFAEGLTHERLLVREHLLRDLDQLREGLDIGGSMEALDRYSQQAVEMVIGERAQQAFDISL